MASGFKNWILKAVSLFLHEILPSFKSNIKILEKKYCIIFNGKILIIIIAKILSSKMKFSQNTKQKRKNIMEQKYIILKLICNKSVINLNNCVWIIVRLQDPNMAHYTISNRVSYLLIFYLLVFDRIYNVMCLNKMSRTSSRNIGPQHKKYSSIFNCTLLLYFTFSNLAMLLSKASYK